MNNWNERGREVAVDWPREEKPNGGRIRMSGDGGEEEELGLDGREEAQGGDRRS